MTACAELKCPSPRGRAECHCAACHRVFSGVSAFAKHQTFPDGGVLTCHDPAGRGLVPAGRNGVTVWGWPERDGTAWVDARRAG
jgi:hypothetical protein